MRRRRVGRRSTFLACSEANMFKHASASDQQRISVRERERERSLIHMQRHPTLKLPDDSFPLHRVGPPTETTVICRRLLQRLGADVGRKIRQGHSGGQRRAGEPREVGSWVGSWAVFRRSPWATREPPVQVEVPDLRLGAWGACDNESDKLTMACIGGALME